MPRFMPMSGWFLPLMLFAAVACAGLPTPESTPAKTTRTVPKLPPHTTSPVTRERVPSPTRFVYSWDGLMEVHDQVEQVIILYPEVVYSCPEHHRQMVVIEVSDYPRISGELESKLVEADVPHGSYLVRDAAVMLGDVSAGPACSWGSGFRHWMNYWMSYSPEHRERMVNLFSRVRDIPISGARSVEMGGESNFRIALEVPDEETAQRVKNAAWKAGVPPMNVFIIEVAP